MKLSWLDVNTPLPNVSNDYFFKLNVTCGLVEIQDKLFMNFSPTHPWFVCDEPFPSLRPQRGVPHELRRGESKNPQKVPEN